MLCETYGIARDILVNKTRFMDLKQGKVTGERYKLKYSKNKPVLAIKNLYTMSGSDYSKPSLENVKAGIDYDNYYGLYATDKPYDENDIDKGTNVYTQTFFNDKADGKEKILDMQKELTKEERANIADGLQKHIENKLGYLLEPALNIEEGTAWANDVAKHKKAKKLMDKLNEIRNGDFTSGGSIYHSIRNILSDFKPEAQKYNSNYTHKMARDFLLSIGYDGIIDDWRGKRRQIVSFRDDNITVDRHQKAVDYGKLEDVNELTDEEPKLSVEPLDKENRSNTSETALTKLKSPLEISDKDFLHPTRSIELPSLPQETLDLIGAEQKPILLKRNILEKNLIHHKELTPEQSREILNKALYNSDELINDKQGNKPNYWVVVKLGNKNGIVVVDFDQKKNHIEIVGWRYASEKSINQIKERAKREGGQVLVTKNEEKNVQGASGLHALPSSSALNINNQIQKVNKKSETLADILNPANYKGKMYSVENLIAEVATKLVKWGINKTIDAAKNMMKYMLNAYHRFNRNYNDWKNEISKSSIIEKKMTEEQLKEVFADIEKEENAVIKVGDEVDATGFDEYLDERAKAEGITSNEDIKKAKELAKIAKKKAIGEKYLKLIFSTGQFYKNKKIVYYYWTIFNFWLKCPIVI